MQKSGGNKLLPKVGPAQNVEKFSILTRMAMINTEQSAEKK